MNPTKIFPRTLALYVTRRGIAFTCFIHPRMLVDWGIKEIRGEKRHADTLHAAELLIEKFRPHILVIEGVGASRVASRRAPRINALYRAIARYGEQQQIEVIAYSRQDMKAVFATVGAATKHELNGVVAQLLPVLSARQPRKRRSFDPEAPIQGLFDAAALGLTFFAATKRLDIVQAMRVQRIDSEPESPDR